MNPSRTAAVLLASCVIAPAAHAGGAVKHSAAALEHSVEALGHAMVGGVKLVSGAAALPFTVAGEIGKASGAIGEDLWQFADQVEPGMLPVSNEVITADPRPGEALQGRQDRAP